MSLGARIHWAMGRSLAFWGWHDGAAQAFADAARRAPGFTEAWFGRGDVLLRAGRAREAAEAFAEVVRLRPSDAEAQGNLVLAYGRAGQWRECEAALRRLIDLRPEQAELHILHGAVLRRVHRPEEAIRSFRWSLRFKHSPVRFRLGEAMLGETGWEAVMRSYETAQQAGDPAPFASSGIWSNPLHHAPDLPSAPRAVRRSAAWPAARRLIGRWLELPQRPRGR